MDYPPFYNLDIYHYPKINTTNFSRCSLFLNGSEVRIHGFILGAEQPMTYGHPR